MKKASITFSFICLLLAGAGMVFAHNLTVDATISPVDGTVITETTTEVSGTFDNSGCGLDTTISVVASDGSVSTPVVTCDDGMWSWTATWSDYSEGEHTLTASFLATHAQGQSTFEHKGEVAATYTVYFPVQDSDPCADPKNHGQYVSCVAKGTQSEQGKGQAVSAAAKSDIGKPSK